jgi:hypothetical protein
MEIIALYCDDHKQHSNRVCRQNIILMAEEEDQYNNLCALEC